LAILIDTIPDFVCNLQERDSTRKEAQRKFGVFFDDDYDYLQHLKDVDEINEVEPIEEQVFIRRNARPEKQDRDSVPEVCQPS
jgi:protein LTV1